MGTDDDGDLAMKGKERGLREEGKDDDDKVLLVEKGTHHLDHPHLGSGLAKQEVLDGEQQHVGEKPPWKYLKEEENPQLLFQMGK